MARTPVEQILDEFDMGDGLENATDDSAERMAREVLRLRLRLEYAHQWAGAMGSLVELAEQEFTRPTKPEEQ